MRVISQRLRRGLHASWVLLLAVFTACGQIQSESDTTTTFPQITFKGIDHTDATTTTFRGKVLIINVWATWCPPCRREMPSLQRLHDRLDPSLAEVIGLSIEDDDHRVREWLRQTRITFHNYLDAGNPSARELLRISTYPQTYLVAPNGSLVARFEGARDWDNPDWLTLINATASAHVAKAKSLF